MVIIMEFESWRDANLFFKEYMVCSCCNCKYGLSEDKFDESQFICFKTLSPVRLALIRLCPEWENNQGETLKDYEDEDMFTLSDETLEMLEELDGKISFNEIKEYLNNE